MMTLKMKGKNCLNVNITDDWSLIISTRSPKISDWAILKLKSLRKGIL